MVSPNGLTRWSSKCGPESRRLASIENLLEMLTFLGPIPDLSPGILRVSPAVCLLRSPLGGMMYVKRLRITDLNNWDISLGEEELEMLFDETEMK